MSIFEDKPKGPDWENIAAAVVMCIVALGFTIPIYGEYTRRQERQAWSEQVRAECELVYAAEDADRWGRLRRFERRRCPDGTIVADWRRVER